MDTFPQQDTQSPRTAVIAVTAAVVLVVIAVGVWFFVVRPRGATPEGIGGNKTVETPTYTVTAPNEWVKSGAVEVPSGVKTPAQAVQQTEGIPGYATTSVTKVEAVPGQGKDTQLYWQVTTSHGVVTTKASTTQP